MLPDNQLLIPNQQGKMWRDFHSDPHALSVWLGNKLRPRSFLDLPSGSQLAVVPGQTVRAVEVVADDVVRSFDLFVRIRAFFMTAAFISITVPDWFTLQIAIDASDWILSHITATWNGRSPPVSFHVAAWGTTVHHFSERVRVSKRSLKAVVQNVGAWEHNWKWTFSTSSEPQAGTGGARNNQGLQHQVDL